VNQKKEAKFGTAGAMNRFAILLKCPGPTGEVGMMGDNKLRRWQVLRLPQNCRWPHESLTDSGRQKHVAEIRFESGYCASLEVSGRCGLFKEKASHCARK